MVLEWGELAESGGILLSQMYIQELGHTVARSGVCQSYINQHQLLNKFFVLIL
jgi:hypothetical protein